MLTEAGETGVGSPEGQQDEELLAEARALRQHKTRLETRMQILEDHNKQLESQLRRLRELLLQVTVFWLLDRRTGITGLHNNQFNDGRCLQVQLSMSYISIVSQNVDIFN